jgi:hypothetical protein
MGINCTQCGAEIVGTGLTKEGHPIYQHRVEGSPNVADAWFCGPKCSTDFHALLPKKDNYSLKLVPITNEKSTVFMVGTQLNPVVGKWEVVAVIGNLPDEKSALEVAEQVYSGMQEDYGVEDVKPIVPN